MTQTERHRHARKRRHTAITVAVIAAATACGSTPQPPTPVTAGALTDHDVVKLRALDPSPASRKTPAARPRAVKRHQPARISTAIHIAIPNVWARLVQCESSGHWAYGKPGGYTDPGYADYEGGPNFTHQTWTAYKPGGYPTHAYDATPPQQIVVAKRVLRDQGVRAWPVCGPKVGLTIQDAA